MKFFFIFVLYFRFVFYYFFYVHIFFHRSQHYSVFLQILCTVCVCYCTCTVYTRKRYIKIISCWLTFMPSSIIIGHDRVAVGSGEWKRKRESDISFVCAECRTLFQHHNSGIIYHLTKWINYQTPYIHTKNAKPLTQKLICTYVMFDMCVCGILSKQ